LGHRPMCGVELLQGMLVSEIDFYFSMCTVLTHYFCRLKRLRGISEEINLGANESNPLRSVNRRTVVMNHRDLGMSVSASTNNLRRSILTRRSSVS
jgi:hypothetical protein